jgi:hypothetical protein
MGGSVLLVDESGGHVDHGLPAVRSLKELPAVLEQRRPPQ